MSEKPLDVLRRWENQGADWKVVILDVDRVVLDLTTCYGEPMEQMTSDDAELIDYVRESAREREDNALG